MAWVKITDNIVVQKQPNEKEGFIEADDSVTCGMIYDSETETFSNPPVSIDKIKSIKTAQMKSEMYRILADGFQWRETNADDWFTVCVDDAMQGFLTRTLLKLNEGRVSPHGGFIRSNGVNILIDDVGMRELCVFAGTWGDAISAIRIDEIEAVTDWEAFDPYTVDWSINWTAEDASNGWNDNTLTQAP